MKYGEDFRREFPNAEEGFKDAMHQSLMTLHGEERRAPMRFKPLIALILVVLLMMSAGIAATIEQWSLFTSVPEYMQTASEEEQALMKSSFSPVTTHGRIADVTVREAIYDGFAVYLVLDIRHSDPTIFLMPDENAALTDPAGSVVDGWPSDMTLEEYARSLGFISFRRVDVALFLGGMVIPPTLEAYENGIFTFCLRQQILNPDDIMKPSITTQCVTHIKNWSASKVKNGSTILDYIEADLTIPAQPLLEVKASPPEVTHTFEHCGVALSNVTLYRTMLTTYVTADVSITDQEAFDARTMAYYIRASDSTGNSLPVGYFNVGGIMQHGTTPTYRYSSTVSMHKPPDEISFTEYSWASGEGNDILDIFTFPLNIVD